MSNGATLVEFYAGRAADFAGRRIEDVWAMSLDELEATHDYIQWLFPLRERSGVAPNVPVLDDAAIRAFDTPALRARLARSAEVMAAFYGLGIVAGEGAPRVVRTAAFEARRRVWLTRGNHNFLRLTRILKSLVTLGEGALAEGWLAALAGIFAAHGDVIGPVTFAYWRDAVGLPPG